MKWMTKHFFLKSPSGFTLMEMMVVISIIAILAGISLPSLIGKLPDYRLKNAGRELLSDMQFAKLSAVKSNSEWSIVFDTTNNKYFVCSENGADGDWTGLNDSTGGGDNTIHKTVTFDNYKSGVNYGYAALSNPVGTTFGANNVSYVSENVTFDSMGTGKAGYVYLTNSKGVIVYAVGTNSTGVVSMKLWNGSDWI